MTSFSKDKTEESALPAVFLDTVQYTISRIFVLQIHLVLQFEGQIDAHCLKRALRLVMDREPVLGCRFKTHLLRARWQTQEVPRSLVTLLPGSTISFVKIRISCLKSTRAREA